MLWFLLWFSAVGLVLIVLILSYLFRQYQHRALILVHPFALGLDLETAMENIAELTASPLFSDKSNAARDRNGLQVTATSYYYHLQHLLRVKLYKVIVLMEEPEQEEISFLTVCTMTPRTLRKGTKVIQVPTREGRAVPRDGTWKVLLKTLSESAGFRSIEIAGCFLSVNEGVVVHPNDRYSCVNDALHQCIDSGLFEKVRLIEKCCFRLEVDTENVPFSMTAAATKRAIAREDSKRRRAQ